MRYLICLFFCLVTASVFSEEGMDWKFSIENMNISSDNASETSSLTKEGSAEESFHPLRGKPRPLGRGQERQQRNWIFG